MENRDSLDIEIPEKVAMTLAALSGIVSFGDLKASLEEVKKIAEDILLKCVSVVDSSTYIPEIFKLVS